jgi:hypothetical protein
VSKNNYTIEMIERYRLLTEERLANLLHVKNSFVTIEQIRTAVLEGAFPTFPAYVTMMLAALNCADIDDAAINGSLDVIQDVWNYLPHRSLNGRCPAEMMVEHGRDIQQNW